MIGSRISFAGLFTRLVGLDDEGVLSIVTLCMGEALSAGSVAVELIGLHRNVDMADWWEADDALFDLLRDRAVLVALVEEVAGSTVAQANKAEKTKVLKQIICDHLDGADGRPRRERWTPRWMRFPPAAYTDRGGVSMIKHHRCATDIPQVEAKTDDVPVDIDLPAEETDERLAA